MPLIPVLGGRGRGISEFKASLVYRVSSKDSQGYTEKLSIEKPNHLKFFVYLGYKLSVGCSVGKELFPICWLLFCPFESVLCLTETL